MQILSKLAKWLWSRIWWGFFKCHCIVAILLLSPLEKGPSFEQIWMPLTHGCFVQCLVEISPVDMGKSFNFVNTFSLFHYNRSSENDVALHLDKSVFSLHTDALCHVKVNLPSIFEMIVCKEEKTYRRTTGSVKITNRLKSILEIIQGSISAQPRHQHP